MKTTTLARIRAHSPCQEGWEKLLKHLGKTKADDAPVAYSEILKSNGLDDALWCAKAEPDLPWRKLAVLFAMEVLHLMEDNRSVHALEVAWLHASGEASDGELGAARDAAYAAYAAWDAAYAANAANAANAARDAARGAARAEAYAAWDEAQAKQAEIFLKFVED